MKKIDDLQHNKALDCWTFKEDDIKGRYIIEPDDLVEAEGQIKEINGKQYFCATQIGNTGTHKCKVIKSSIQPIEKDSWEKIGKDYYKTYRNWNLSDDTFLKRAKALLQSECEI